MGFNDYQRVVRAAYAGGEFGEVETKKEVAGCGDSLFAFAMPETSTEEDCDSFAAAYQRIERAILELRMVLDALEPHIFEEA
jgi:hypothetical protein